MGMGPGSAHSGWCSPSVSSVRSLSSPSSLVPRLPLQLGAWESEGRSLRGCAWRSQADSWMVRAQSARARVFPFAAGVRGRGSARGCPFPLAISGVGSDLIIYCIGDTSAARVH
jgi:hypothetical protein